MKILIVFALFSSINMFGMMRMPIRAILTRGLTAKKAPTYLDALEREANELHKSKADLKKELQDMEARERYLAESIEKLQKAEQKSASADSVDQKAQKARQPRTNPRDQNCHNSDNYSLASKVRKWDSSMDRELRDEPEELTVGERTFGRGWDR